MVRFQLENLPYEYDALEPYIDEETLHVHHDKHHQTYCDKFNAACENAGVQTDDIKEIFSRVSDYPIAVRNHGGGFWNHNFYWESMSPNGGEPEGELLEAIIRNFGSFEEFKDKFSTNAATLFGSGWTWLGVREDGELVIFNTPNQDNSLMDVVEENAIPLLVIDVWEHAYYIKYKNKRPEYIENFFKVVNWKKVSDRYLDTRN